MKFIHTADWHLGRTLHGVSLLDDQHHALAGFLDLVRDERPDFVIVAGDIFDRSVPGADAVSVLDETLCRLLLDLRVPVFMIAGNHDSPERLGFGARLFRERGLHVAGPFAPEITALPATPGSTECEIFLLPYAEPAIVRERYGDPEIVTHDLAMAGTARRIAAARRQGARAILVGHAFVEGGSATDSERPLSVGNAGTVSAAHLADFDYVALGHLHRPQRVGRDAVRYAGSLLKYSCSEARDVKSVEVVELDATGLRVRAVPLPPRRELSVVAGNFAELLAGGRSHLAREHYLRIDLADETMPLDAMGRLREVFPHLLHLERQSVRAAAESPGLAPRDHRTVRPADMFDAFFQEVTGQPIAPAQQAKMASVLDEMAAQENVR